MTTTFLFCVLEPTHGQVDVYLTNTLQITYSTPADFQNQINAIEVYLRGKAGNPSFYQFKTSSEFNNQADCNSERNRKIAEYTTAGLNVQEVTYFNDNFKLELKLDALSDFYSTQIILPHLSSMAITFGYNAHFENCIKVIDYNGTLIRVSNNYFGDNSVLQIQQNISGHQLIYQVAAEHKNTPPDGGEPWYQSWGKLLDSSPSNITIGWKDRAINTTYGNAVVSVVIF